MVCGVFHVRYTEGNLNGVKPNERVVKCRWLKFK